MLERAVTTFLTATFPSREVISLRENEHPVLIYVVIDSFS